MTVSDDTGQLEVTVPDDWDRAVADDGWRPPVEDSEFAALSVGTRSDWNRPDVSAEGVFVGVLPGTELPSRAAAPGVRDTDARQRESRRGIDHRRAHRLPRRRDRRAGRPGRRQPVAVGPGPKRDRATATRVLDSVETHGI